MANISSADGKITLRGDWTQEALDALDPVMDAWGFYGEYGIQSYDGFDLDHLSCSFYGCGRWSFSGTLDSFDDWTRDLIEKKPKRQDGTLLHDITQEQYDNLIKIMHENDLTIEFNFEDIEEGFEVHIIETGVFSSDGNKLSYGVISCREAGWEDMEKGALKGAVNFFEKFLSEPDRKKLRKWIKNNIPPSDLFGDYTTDDEIAEYFAYDGFDEICSFYNKFRPDTEEWEEFVDLIEEISGTNLYDEIMEDDEEYYDEDDDEYDDDDEDDEEDEDINDWDDEPQYPMDDIDSLEISGKAFVLSGEFQNCDGDRDEVKKLIEEKGGRCTSSVSGKTNYLVLGDFGDVGAKKVEEALEQREKGKDIKIISEYDLFRFL